MTGIKRVNALQEGVPVAANVRVLGIHHDVVKKRMDRFVKRVSKKDCGFFVVPAVEEFLNLPAFGDDEVIERLLKFRLK